MEREQLTPLELNATKMENLMRPLKKSPTYPNAELIQHTLRVWEPRLKRKLTTEEARKILEDVVGYFELLIKWDRENSDSN